MSLIRQTGADPPSPGDLEDPYRPVVAWSCDYADGTVVAEHTHRRAQLVYAARGVMTVGTGRGMWVIPSHRAVWIPAGMRHGITMSGEVAMRTLYVDSQRVADLPAECSVVQVSPLLRELIMEAMRIAPVHPRRSPESRLLSVLLDQIRSVTVAPLHLPQPVDARLRCITDHLRDHPYDNRTLEEWSRAAGASSRTLLRLFLRETGMSFRAWRQQLRLLIGLKKLAAGDSVTSVALDVGYNSPSAFIAMFRQALGESPSQYFRDRK